MQITSAQSIESVSSTTTPPPCSQLYFQRRASDWAKERISRQEIKRRLVAENHACEQQLSEQALDFVVSVVRPRKSSVRTSKAENPASTASATASSLLVTSAVAPILIQPAAERALLWQQIETFLTENYLNPDIDAAKIMFATVASHRIADYPPAWAMGIAPAGSMKTEILKSLDGLPSVYLVDEVTANTFISGKHSQPGEPRTTPASLLHRIGDEGIIISADFSTVLEIDEKTRGKILSQLRRIYDGQLRREFGSEENLDEREWKGRITLLAGATPEVDRFHKVFAALGDRFARVRWPRAGGVEAAMMAMNQDRSVSERMKELVHEFFLPVLSQQKIDAPKLGHEMMLRIANLSEIVALARTYVPRNSYDREIDGAVQAESNTRLPQQLAQIGRGWAVLMNRPEVDEDAFALIRRAAWDSIPPVRRAIVEALIAGRKPHSARLPFATVDRALEELGAIGFLAMTKVSYFPPNTETVYALSENARELLIGAGEKIAAPDIDTSVAIPLTPSTKEIRDQKVAAWLATQPKGSVVTYAQIQSALGEEKLPPLLIDRLFSKKLITSTPEGSYKVL
jgi:hypothetical protein